MQALLICSDQNVQPLIPPTMGQPKAGQLVGTPRENLTELAGRICYDSLGQGRPSIGYHDHIKEVGHLSVYEHVYANIVFDSFKIDNHELYEIFCNRRGVYYESRIATVNLRTVLEWEQYQSLSGSDEFVGKILKHAFNRLMPMAAPPTDDIPEGAYRILARPECPKRRFLSFWLYGSRGFSHEMVRHRFNMSQRSTRYVDELPEEFGVDDPLIEEVKAAGEYTYHPLLLKYLEDPAIPLDHRQEISDYVRQARQCDRLAYMIVVQALEEYTGNRKQSRGAARGCLANALSTELIYTASEYDWKRIFKARVSDPADAEIRKILYEAASQAGFDYEFAPASDGIGSVIV